MNPSLTSFLASSSFAVVWLPGITVAVTILFKAVSRSDRYGAFAKEDLAVGVDLSVASIFAFATHLGLIAKRTVQPGAVLLEKEADLLRDSPWVLIAMLLGLVVVTFVTRVAGWRTAHEMRWIAGIILPLCYGLVLLSLVALLITS